MPDYQKIVAIKERVSDLQERIILRQLRLLHQHGFTESDLILRVRLWEHFILHYEHGFLFANHSEFSSIPGLFGLQCQYDRASAFLLRFMRNRASNYPGK